MTDMKKLAIWLALIFSSLSVLGGCSDSGIETRPEPVKVTAQIPPLDAAMLRAAARGDNASLKELLDKGVNINMRGGDRNTPIMEAAYAGHLDTVKLLLDHGADLSAKKNDGATPLTLTSNKEITELFHNVSALVAAAGNGDSRGVNESIDKGTPLNGLDQSGHSALTEACWNGKTGIVKLLLDKGADPNIGKSDGETPLSLATSRQHADIVKLLQEAIAKQAKGNATPSGK